MRLAKLSLRLTELPSEVKQALGFWRSSQVHRVFCVKSEGWAVRDAAWRDCRRYGHSIGVREGPEYTGWRSCHTDNFWVWWADDLEDLHALAAEQAGGNPEDAALALATSPRFVDNYIDLMWKTFQEELR
jgi:hypothetical protein